MLIGGPSKHPAISSKERFKGWVRKKRPLLSFAR